MRGKRAIASVSSTKLVTKKAMAAAACCEGVGAICASTVSAVPKTANITATMAVMAIWIRDMSYLLVNGVQCDL